MMTVKVYFVLLFLFLMEPTVLYVIHNLKHYYPDYYYYCYYYNKEVGVIHT
jgi:hypothetical protein